MNLGAINDIQNRIIAAANNAGIPSSIALSVAQQESSFNPNAVSSAGAIGVFQLMPSSFPGQDIGDLSTNISLGISYLKQLYSQYGDWGTALAAYNWGPGKVNAALASGASFPQQVLDYVQRILGVTSQNDASVAEQLVSSDGITPVEPPNPSSIDPSIIAPLVLVGAIALLAVWD